jgi:glycosyltransferase involved in cell wall biosynthesis
MGDAMKRADVTLRVRRIWRIRRLVGGTIRPDVVVGFQHGPFVTLALALLGTRRPVVAAERNAPDRLDHLRAGRRRYLLFQSFRLASRILVQFESYRPRYPAFLRTRIRTIPNPVFPADRSADPVGPAERRVLLCVGRLGYQKNPHCLVRAFARVAPAHPEWVLRLVGDGEDRDGVTQLAGDLGVLNRVEMPGARPDIEVEYQYAQLFVLASRWEGFPNAIAEAMAHGLPVVGFRDCAGVADLIRHDREGLLAPGNGDSESLARSLDQAMRGADLRTRLGAGGLAIAERYRPEEVWDTWERVLGECVREQE